MVVMFVRNENAFDCGKGKSELAHPPFRFPAGDPCVDQYRLIIVTDIITIAVTAGIKGCNIECHAYCKITSNQAYIGLFLTVIQIRFPCQINSSANERRPVKKT